MLPGHGRGRRRLSEQADFRLACPEPAYAYLGSNRRPTSGSMRMGGGRRGALYGDRNGGAGLPERQAGTNVHAGFPSIVLLLVRGRIIIK